MTIDTAAHIELAQRVLPRARLLVGGKWLDETAYRSVEHVNPSTGLRQAAIPVATKDDVDAAVEAAARALPDWREVLPIIRRNLLRELARLVEAHQDELSSILTLESGLPFSMTQVFTRRGADFLEYNASIVDAIEGQVIPVNPAQGLNYVLPEPFGVVALIMTWNGGLSALGRKAGAALAAGNTIVIKPSDLAPFSAIRFAELAEEAGFPDGVINVIHGDAVAGEALVRHRLVRKVSFTGGVETARKIQEAAASGPKPVALELGGKSANIVFEDADLEQAALSAASGAFYMSGQGCALPTRLIIHASVHDQVVELVAESAKQMAIGDPFERLTTIGPIISKPHFERVLGLVEEAMREKAGDVVLDGVSSPLDLPGFFMGPTLLSNVDPDSRIAQTEVFGPILSCFSFDSDEQAIALANATEYGLNAYIHTSSLERAHSVARRVEAGSVAVNGFQGAANRGTVATPFGGVKASGFGREGGRAGIDEFMTLKNIYVGLV
jgi:aldehyde dehydrogenase (NAD+)